MDIGIANELVVVVAVIPEKEGKWSASKHTYHITRPGCRRHPANVAALSAAQESSPIMEPTGLPTENWDQTVVQQIMTMIVSIRIFGVFRKQTREMRVEPLEGWILECAI